MAPFSSMRRVKKASAPWPAIPSGWSTQRPRVGWGLKVGSPLPAAFKAMRAIRVGDGPFLALAAVRRDLRSGGVVASGDGCDQLGIHRVHEGVGVAVDEPPVSSLAAKYQGYA